MHALDVVGFIGIMAILVWWRWSSRMIPATKCGHKTRISGSVVIFGKHVAFRLPVKDGQTQYCLECIGKMAVRCASCGEPVIVGDTVTLRAPIAGRRLVESNGCKSDGAGRYIGCYRCGHTRSDGVGFLVIPGKVRIIPHVNEPVIAMARVK